ncbi:FxDxF family PEP-CTERM protein [uncultured Aquabacterium sp.]|jgi:hypothetical protein|uniref:FxDxF family PEP-CTERM protein n=1 Tax=uncultured Aquabacterium sp. TaxID=158753 RepID=UPI002609932C|nr:FxDxF family PEP-CTERM protein [uncultured Aquabacterium sp.]
MLKFLPIALAAFVSASAFAAADREISVTVPGLLESYGEEGWTQGQNPAGKITYISIGKNQTFLDVISFEIGSASNVGYGFIINTLGDKNIAVNSFSLTGDGVNISQTSPAGNLLSYTFDNLARGQYTLSLGGVATGQTGGKFTVTLAAAPVPEPEALALALAGLGVAGFVARRKQA